jgi:tetratricopeptide (TPR) repeat protein
LTHEHARLRLQIVNNIGDFNMSGFKALNIESDDESDIEVDDTKEIQIEETLKLYQAALKYHSEGPGSFDKAAEAYRQLFESEIFHYPESQTELRRIELYGPSVDLEDGLLDVAAPTGLSSGNLETNNSTLPQILHLSHKNYAQFRLEALAANIETLNVSLRQILADATAALDHFVQALDKDATDLDLWRRTATVGELLNSKRAARFCLEAVLDGDEEGLASLMTLPGLEDSIAGEQLRDLVVTLEDQLSALQAPLPTSKRKFLSKILKQRLDPYHNIVSRQKSLLKQDAHHQKQLPRQERAIISAPDTWTGLGDALLCHQNANQYSSAPVSVISFDLMDKQMQSDLPTARESVVPVAVQIFPANRVRFMPTSLAEQFPGMGDGRPTVQPRIADADHGMRVVSRPDEVTVGDMDDSSTVTLPTRKRSGDAAGLVDGAEESRAKSRRTRGRESLLELAESKQPTIDANRQWEFEQQLNERKAADDWLYETVGALFERVGAVGFEAGKHVRHELEAAAETEGPSQTRESSDGSLHVARSDFAAFLNAYSDRFAPLLLVGGENMNIGHSASSAGSSSLGGAATSKPQVKFDTMPNDCLQEFLETINHGWLSTAEVAYLFIKMMTTPQDGLPGSSTYAKHTWPESLKTVIVRTAHTFDNQIFASASAELAASQQRREKRDLDIPSDDKLSEMLLTILELHLDVFCLIREPNSGVDADTVTEQGDRLQRWSNLTREMMLIRSMSTSTVDPSDHLNLRFIWATTFIVSVSDDVDQDYALECMQDLRRVVLAASDTVIYLPNNAIMPELSVAAIDRKLSELTTKDFFAKVTENEMNDPAATIENLEPLLEALSARQTSSSDTDDMEDAVPQMVPQDLIGFLDGSSVSVKLMLWQRLRDAYATIEYQPMVVSCYFRMMTMILDEVRNTAFLDLEQEERQKLVLKSVRILHVMIGKIFNMCEKSSDTWECLDEYGLQRAITLLGELLHILQVFNVYEDSIQIGQTTPPLGANDLVMPSFVLTTQAVHELQIQTWMILYSLLKEGIAQNREAYPTPVEDRFDFLRCLHRNLGLRGICDGLNRKFVRMVKDEFFQMTHVDGYDQEQAQVLYDLYGLNCFMNPSYELIEHRCTHDAFLDKSIALQAVDLLLLQASKLPIKDLVKHSLKDTIEKVHGALSRKKPTEAILHNREIYRAYLRSSIRPVELYGCLKGDSVELMHKPVPENDAVLASKGWYFLMGHIALTRFRTTKKPGGSPQEDVDIAIAFFMQDLEYSMGNWQTWFRLAQAYDTKIDENLMWSADKMNNEMSILVSLQRAAIHCYTMATSLAKQSADATSETGEKLTELYHDFAMRVYNSSRGPLLMRAFAVEEIEKFLSTDLGVVRGGSFKPLRAYTAWKFAKTLFTRTLEHRSGQWMIHFMLGKCLWKMHSAPRETLQPNDQPPNAPKVFESFLRALELVPGKNSRDSKSQPILEPHYKLLIIVHKMYMRHSISLEEAGMLLHNTSYAQSVALPDTREEWPQYVLAILKRLRAADKQNWHHRMIYRTAQIIHDFPHQVQDFIPRQCEDEISDDALLGPAGARHELTQQMFTKTMVLQVWRPDAERPGRHFVYTTQYTRFFVKILEDLQDRTNLEALARRVRRRNHELFEHTAVWQDICSAYLRILRKHAGLPEGLETSTFSAIFHDEFLERKEPLERWMQARDNGENAALDVLRESQELKKINQGLVKPGPIDDLTGDAYAYLFQTIGKTLSDEEKRVKQEEAARNAPPPPPPQQPQEPAPPARNPAMSLMHLMNIDGASGHVTPDPAPTPTPQAPATMVPDATAAAVPVVRRKVGVGRREIRNAAETCYPKTLAQTASRVTGAVPESRVQVVINSSRPSLGGDMSVETSAPGSIHDSADDESELSELEEDDADDEDEGGQRKPMFPNLVGRERAEGEDSDTEGEIEGDETAEDAEMGEGDGEEETLNEIVGDGEHTSAGAMVS